MVAEPAFCPVRVCPETTTTAASLEVNVEDVVTSVVVPSERTAVATRPV